MALNLSLLPASVQKAIAANPELFKRSTTPAADRANTLSFNASSEGGQAQGFGANVGGGMGGKGGQTFADLASTFNGRTLLDATMTGGPNRGYMPIDSTIDFADAKRWLPGAEQAILGGAKWDDNAGLLIDAGAVQKYGVSPELSFMDKLVPALIMSAVGMGAGQMFQAAQAGGFMPAAQSGFDSATMFSGGGGTGAGAGGAATGGYAATEQAALDNLIKQLEVADAAGTIGQGGGAAAGINAANQQALDELLRDLVKADELNGGNAAPAPKNQPGGTGAGGAPGGQGASLTDIIRSAVDTIKPYKDALSVIQTGASLITGAQNRDAMKDAASDQARIAQEQLRTQQAAQAAQEEAARQALELQRQANEKQLAQQNAQLQEQLRLQQSMASYQQQVYSQQLAQAAKESKLAEEQLRRNSQRNPDFAGIVSGNRRTGQSGAAGTMLTGSGGVDPTTLLLGRSTLLGG